MFKKTILILLAVLGIMLAVLFFNYFTFNSKQISVESIPILKIEEAALARFSKSITFSTISYKYESPIDTAEFLGLHDHLATSFPLCDSLLEKELIGFSLLYKWKGSDESLAPIVLMSHMDVVPVDAATLADWEAAPFSGIVKNGKIYGRGTMDDKISVMAIMEAVEMHLAAGFVPKQTIYLAFGHDEEIGGENGAGLIAKKLGAEGIKPAFVLDEGGFLADGMVPGMEKTLAMINIAEKGYVSYELQLTTPGGHASAPPADNTVGSMAKAITRLEENQFAVRMVDPVKYQIEHVGPEMPFIQKLVFANTWLFGKPLLAALTSRTTTAPTIFNSGVKDNVIPTTATAVVNFRILQGQTVEDVRKHIVETIADDRITVKIATNANEPSEISDITSLGYKSIEKTVHQVIPDPVVSPGLLGGGTDTKHWEGIAENAYRFFPIRISKDNVTGFHGINEHITVENYYETIRFYHQMIVNLN
jgi:carboxypeptidase PM20D1